MNYLKLLTRYTGLILVLDGILILIAEWVKYGDDIEHIGLYIMGAMMFLMGVAFLLIAVMCNKVEKMEERMEWD